MKCVSICKVQIIDARYRLLFWSLYNAISGDVDIHPLGWLVLLLLSSFGAYVDRHLKWMRCFSSRRFKDIHSHNLSSMRQREICQECGQPNAYLDVECFFFLSFPLFIFTRIRNRTKIFPNFRILKQEIPPSGLPTIHNTRFTARLKSIG
ncbi:hypothetical protein P175DRAFT_0181959 [Aspergillus ochraceoroseus IBT 24754]|uniref:Uncharacterized protein n=1 Tax=Aspergillus ochraceoroseus IBT 24754 TaxID=1392256 RepID=A0A2T5LYK0_9EURO|nr:uncharacterized protein P175DRAFT_0181959 [Aspergillus ochraceoroseus IBT 24754]PTU21364.1 hypothetical protein P175DRAFT_0181959 [Aspergillus ochraceoroseus IBT 24754]